MATHLNLLWVQLTTTVGSLLLLFDPRSTTETHKPRRIGKGRSVERSGVDEEMLCKWFVVISIPILQIAPPCHSSAPHHWIRIVKWSSIILVRRKQPHRLQREEEWTDNDCHTQAESFVQQGIQIFIELSCQDELCKTNWSGTDLSEGSEYLQGNMSVHLPLHHTLGLTEHKGHPRAGRLFFASIVNRSVVVVQRLICSPIDAWMFNSAGGHNWKTTGKVLLFGIYYPSEPTGVVLLSCNYKWPISQWVGANGAWVGTTARINKLSQVKYESVDCNHHSYQLVQETPLSFPTLCCGLWLVMELRTSYLAACRLTVPHHLCPTNWICQLREI